MFIRLSDITYSFVIVVVLPGSEEILLKIKNDYNITENPKKVVIGGISSGGICAFNAAWHRPDVFGNVISHVPGLEGPDGREGWL